MCTYVCDYVFIATIITAHLSHSSNDEGQEFLRMNDIQTLSAGECFLVNNALDFVSGFRISCILQMSEQNRVILFIWFTLPFSEQSHAISKRQCWTENTFALRRKLVDVPSCADGELGFSLWNPSSIFLCPCLCSPNLLIQTHSVDGTKEAGFILIFNVCFLSLEKKPFGCTHTPRMISIPLGVLCPVVL